MASQESSIVIARETFTYSEGGLEYTVHKGATVRVGHRMLTGREHMFKPLVVDYDYTLRPSQRGGR